MKTYRILYKTGAWNEYAVKAMNAREALDTFRAWFAVDALMIEALAVTQIRNL